MSVPKAKALLTVCAALLLCGCGQALSEREIVRAVFFARQQGAYSACLLLADLSLPELRAVCGDVPLVMDLGSGLLTADPALPGEPDAASALAAGADVVAVVTRYFGGVKLGVRGLIEAYGTAAEMAAEEAGAVEMEFHRSLRLTCGYDYSKTLTTNLKKWGFPEGRQNIVYGEKVEIALEVPLSMQAELATPLDEMSARNFITSPLWGYELLVREKWR